MELALAGAGLSALATLEEGKQAAKLGKIQRNQLFAEAEAVKQTGRTESREKRKEARRFQGRQLAAIGAQGGTVSGSNLAILAKTAGEFEADASIIQRNFALQATQLQNRGILAKFRGDLARRNARMRALAGFGKNVGTGFLLANQFGGGGGGGASTGTPASTNIGTSQSVQLGIPLRR